MANLREVQDEIEKISIAAGQCLMDPQMNNHRDTAALEGLRQLAWQLALLVEHVRARMD